MQSAHKNNEVHVCIKMVYNIIHMYMCLFTEASHSYIYGRFACVNVSRSRWAQISEDLLFLAAYCGRWYHNTLSDN